MLTYTFVFIMCMSVSGYASETAPVHQDIASKPVALITGTIVGATSPLIYQPFATFKTYAQCNQSMKALKLKDLWRGVSIASACLGCNTGIQTGLQDLLLPYGELGSTLGAGALSAYILAAPSELIIAQQQLHGKNATKTIKTIYQVASMRGFWRGSNWVAGREALFTTGYLYLAPKCAQHLKKHGTPDTLANIIGGIFGGVVAMIASHPCDTIKTKLAADIPHDKTQSYIYKNGWQILKSNSCSDLFKGCAPRIVGGTVAITWFTLLTPYIKDKLQSKREF